MALMTDLVRAVVDTTHGGRCPRCRHPLTRSNQLKLRDQNAGFTAPEEPQPPELQNTESGKVRFFAGCEVFCETCYPR